MMNPLKKLLNLTTCFKRQGQRVRPRIQPDQATCERIVRLIDCLDYDFSQYCIEHFAESLRRHHPLPIRVVRYPTTFSTAIGLWYHTEQVEFVVIPQNEHLHPLLVEHIGLHEIAHILLQHPPIPLTHVSLKTVLASGASQNRRSAMGRTMLFNQPYQPDNPQEIEADYMAILLWKRVEAGQPRGLSSIAGMQPIGQSFTFGDGW